MLSQLPKFTKNFYFIISALFLMWMLFIDSNDFYSQYQLKSKRVELEIEKKYFEEEIAVVKSEREALLNSDELLEKFAREKYFLKKESEDVFVIVEKD
jgi:cell division protein FtsB